MCSWHLILGSWLYSKSILFLDLLELNLVPFAQLKIVKIYLCYVDFIGQTIWNYITISLLRWQTRSVLLVLVWIGLFFSAPFVGCFWPLPSPFVFPSPSCYCLVIASIWWVECCSICMCCIDLPFAVFLLSEWVSVKMFLLGCGLLIVRLTDLKSTTPLTWTPSGFSINHTLADYSIGILHMDIILLCTSLSMYAFAFSSLCMST